MARNDQGKPAGYAALIERYALDVIPHWHKSLVTARGSSLHTDFESRRHRGGLPARVLAGGHAW